MKIALTQGMCAEIDDADYALVNEFKWHVTKRRTTWYARTNVGRKQLFMHRLLLPNVPRVDHVDRDGLNNKRSNLRPASTSENGGNSGLNRKNSSGYRGVCRYRNRWLAFIGGKKRRTYLGSFATPEAAARAYDKAARERYGEFAYQNFPTVSGQVAQWQSASTEGM